jgi:hypothetical protein
VVVRLELGSMLWYSGGHVNQLWRKQTTEYSSSSKRPDSGADTIMVGTIPCRLPPESGQQDGHEDME